MDRYIIEMLDRCPIFHHYGQDLGEVRMHKTLESICADTHIQAGHHRTKVRPVPSQRTGNII